MDEETKIEFKQVNQVLGEIKEAVTKHVSYSDGLNLQERMPCCERNIDNLKNEKASWKGLYLVTVLILTAFGVALAVLKVQ